MNNSGIENEFEQVKARATKSDQSREKSLYFLLLAVGRQCAAKNQKLRNEYREALQTLSVEKFEIYWNITLNVSGRDTQIEINRSEFQFYKTGFSGNQDEISESNRKNALEFWTSFENLICLEVEPTKKTKTGLRFISRIDSILKVNHLELIGLLVVVLSPPIIQVYPYMVLAYFPLVKLFWYSRFRVYFILLYIISIWLSIINLLSSPSPIQNTSQVVFFALLATLIWSHLDTIQSRSPGISWKVKLLISILVFFGVISALQGVDLYFLTSFLFTVLISNYLNQYRKRFITIKKIVLSTMGGEIAIAIGLGVHFIQSVNGSLTFLDANSIVVATTYLILWTLNFFIYGRYSISLRVFTPFLFTPVILNQTISSYNMLITFFILSVIAITNSSSKKVIHN